MNARISLLLVIALAGCGASPGGSGTTAARDEEITRVRAHAAANPSDPAAQRALAEWELLGEGGDVEVAEAAITRAEALAPSDVALAYLRGILMDQRGRPNE